MAELFTAPAVQEPSLEEIEFISKKLKLKCSPEEIQSFHEFYKTILKSYQRVNEIAEPQLPVKYPRLPGQRDDTDSAWYWRCDIQGASSGKLFGKTIAVKDDIMVAGIPMMNGSKVLEGYTPDADATVVTRVLDAGGRIMGKSVCLDHCFGGDSFNCASGVVSNPYDSSRNAGGSSTGSATLVARGEVDMALGEDAAGSIRVPAAWCGIVAMKPTFGLVPYTGIVPFEITLDHAGPMTRTIYDCALLLENLLLYLYGLLNGLATKLFEVMAGYDGGLDPRQPQNIQVPEYTNCLDDPVSGKRIGVLKEGFDDADNDVREFVKAAADMLKQAGAIVEEVSIPMHNDAWHIFLPIDIEGSYSCMIEGNGSGYGWKGHYPVSMQEAFARGRNLRPYDLLTNVKMASIFGEYIKTNYQNKFYGKSQNIRRRLTEAYDAIFKQYDVLIMPTSTMKATKLPTTEDSVAERLRLSLGAFKNTAAFDATGHPALTMNTGFSNGLPIGMMIVGRMFDETTVFQIARAYEKIRDH